MKLLEDIRGLFSRYELAAAGQVLHLLFVGRWWPERECFSCGTRLDVI